MSVAVLALLFYRVGLLDVLAICAKADPRWLVGAFLLYAAGQVVSALRWRALAHAVGFSVPLGDYLHFYFIGMFFGLAVPSTIGADGTRTLYLGRTPPGRAAAFSSVAFDRWIGLVALVAVGVLALLLGPSGELPRGLVTMLLVFGVTLVAGWLLAPRFAFFLPEGRWRRLLQEDLAPFFRDAPLLARATVLSFAVQAFQILAQKLLADALGLAIPLGFIAIYHPLIALAAAAPITVGGFGLREATYAYLLPHVGIAADDAVALGLLWWAIGAAVGLVGGALYLLRRGAPE